MMCLLTSIPCFSAILNSLRLMYNRQPITLNTPKPPLPRWLCAQSQRRKGGTPNKLNQQVESLGTSFRREFPLREVAFGDPFKGLEAEALEKVHSQAEALGTRAIRWPASFFFS